MPCLYVVLATFLVACGGTDLLPEADILGPDVIVTDQIGPDTTPPRDWGQPDEGDDAVEDDGADEGQDVPDVQGDDAEPDAGVEDPGADEGQDAQEDAAEDEGGDEGADVEDGEPCSWLFNVCWKTTQCTDPECFEEDCVALLSDDATAAWRAIEDCTAAYCRKHPIAHCQDEAWALDCYPLLQACLADVD